MKYDFETLIDRRGTNSLKWDVKENELPMWVADMDFQTAPEIIEVLKEKVCHGIFGYTIIPNPWHEAIIGWWKTLPWIQNKKGVVALLYRRHSCHRLRHQSTDQP